MPTTRTVHVGVVAEKACTKCKLVKPASEFSPAKTKIGLYSSCRACANKQALKYRYANLEKCQESFRAWNRTHVAENTAKSMEYKRRNPHKARARALLNNAVKRGKMVRGSCEKCGEPNAQGHHEDYSRPLEVHWMCRRCHGMEHRTTPEGIAAREQGR